MRNAIVIDAPEFAHAVTIALWLQDVIPAQIMGHSGDVVCTRDSQPTVTDIYFDLHRPAQLKEIQKTYGNKNVVVIHLYDKHQREFFYQDEFNYLRHAMLNRDIGFRELQSQIWNALRTTGAIRPIQLSDPVSEVA